jgi:hypothetical protein
MKFENLFRRRLTRSVAGIREPFAKEHIRRRRRSGASLQFSATAESLEDRRLLAFQYWGITHTTNAPQDPEAYQWNFEVSNANPADPAVMYVRENDILGRMEFDYTTAFSGLQAYNELINISPSLPPTGFTSSTVGPGWLNAPPPGGSFAWIANWNYPLSPPQTFYLSKLRVTCAPGTVDPTFVLQTGNTFRLALEVDFSNAAPGSTGRVYINAPLENNSYPTTSPVDDLPSFIASYEFKADEIFVQAPITPRVSIRYDANYYAATDLISIENSVTGGLTALVSEGDFKIAAGASVTGSTSVRLGQGVPTGASTSAGWGYGGNGGDILIDGEILGAGEVLLQVNSLDPRRILTGATGKISGTGSLALYNMGGDGGLVDVRTAGFGVTNIFAGSPVSTSLTVKPVANISINVDQTAGDLVLNSLPASQGAISLKASDPTGKTIKVNANFDTQASLTLDAGTLDIVRPISTAFGDLTLLANTISIGSGVSAGVQGIGNLLMTARTGGITLASAAIAQAPGDSILLSAAQGITSSATLRGERLEMTAGAAGSINVKSNVNVVRAKAGQSITIADDDSLTVEDAQTTAGTITVTAKGLLALDAVTAGAGDIIATTTAAGLMARDLQTTNGNIKLTANDGDITILGGVTVGDTAKIAVNDLLLTADKGNVVLDPAAVIVAADQINLTSPLGRILSPGRVTNVVVDSSGSDYASAPSVTLSPGSGAVATPKVGDGFVTSLRIANGGAGYTTAPSIVFDNAGTSGSGAAATAQVSQGVITGVTITNRGTGYKTAPKIRVVGGSGSNAEIVASINGLTELAVSYPSTAAAASYGVAPTVVISTGEGATSGAISVDGLGRIQSVNVSTPGSGYVVPPTVAITDSSGSGSGATAVAVLTTGLPSVTVASAGTGYSGGTTVTFPAPGGGGATATGVVSLGLTLASVTGPISTGSGYAVGDLVQAIAGSGAQFRVTGISGSGGVTTVTPTATGGNYTTGDTLYLAGNGGSGLILTVASVDAGGRINTVTISSQGTGFSVGNVLAHVGGSNGRFQVQSVNGSGAITGLTLVDPGTGYTNRPTALAGGSGFGAAPTFNDQNYQIAGVTVLTPGSGYNPSASVAATFSNAGSGTGASATGEPASVVGSITVVNRGSGYAAATTTVTLTSPASGGGASSQAVSVDGQGSILSVNLAANGAGYTGTPTVTIVDQSGSGRGASAIANLTGGVTEVLLTNGGAGYAVAPTVTIAAPLGGGTAATAIAVLGTTGSTTGVVQSLRIMTSGSGYAIGEVPAVTFTGANTTGASATATVTNVVTGITITSAGLGYDPSTTRVSIDPIGSGATAVANLTGGVLSASILSGGSGYSAGTTTVTISGPAGGGSAATATATIVGGVITGLTVTNPGYGYAKGEQPTVTISGGDGLADASATVGTIVGSIRLTASGSGYLSTALPTVTLVPFGSGAAATSTIVVGGVTGYVVDAAGSGYTSNPIATITGVGTNASATVSTSAGEVTNVVPATGGYGTGYNVPPNVVISSGGGSGAQVTALVSGVTNVAVTNPGSYYAVPPTVLFSSPAAGGRVAEATAVISDVVQLSAQRLSWTAMEQPLSAIVSQFDRIKIALTGAGDIDIDRPDGSMVLEGVTTVDGSIRVSASALTVTGAITTGDASSQRNRSISLEATGGDLLIDAPVGSLLAGAKVRTPLADSVTLLAPAGAIKSTTTPPGLVTTNTIIFDARDGATLNTDTNTIRGAVQISTANVSITQTTVDLSSNTLPLTATSVTANGGSIAIKTDNVLTVGTVDAGTAGTVSLTSTKNILASATPPAVANVVGKSATISSTSGKIDLDVSLESLTASAVASSIAIDSVGTGPIDLVSVTARDSIRIGAASHIVATSVTASTGGVSLTATGTTSNVRVGQISAKSNTVAIDAGNDIVSSDPLASTRDVSATAARLTAGGKIALRTDITTLSAAAVGDITIDESSAIVLGDSKAASPFQYVKSTGGSVAVTAGGAIDAFWVESAAVKSIGLTSTGAGVNMQSVTGGTVTVSAKGNVSQATGATSVIDATTLTVTGTGQPISLDTADNRIGTFSATNGAGSIALKDTTGGLILGTITGGTVSVVSTGTGPVTQSGAMDAVNLTVNGVGKAITLDNAGNKIAVFASSNAGGEVTVRDTDANLAIAGITGGKVTVVAAGAVTQARPITATTLDVQGNGNSAITLDKDNAVGSFKANSGTGDIYFKDTTGFEVAGINGGSVILLAAGNVTQAANTAINATALQVHNYAVGGVTLNQNNDLGSVTIGNGSGSVYVKDASGDLKVTGINGGSVILQVAGSLTQTAPINATALQLHTTTGAGPFTLDGANNVVSLTAGNLGNAITFRDVSGGLDITGINGGAVTITSTGNAPITNSGVINAASLTVNGNGTAVTLDAANFLGAVAVSNATGSVTIRDTVGSLAIAGITGGSVTVTASGGGISQTAAIKATSLTVTGNGPSVTLDNPLNSVGTLASASNPGGDVTFVNAGTFSTGPVTAGTAAVGDGNILLKVSDGVVGDINVNGNLTAINDQVTLEARKGTFTLAGGVTIDASMFVYYTATPPTPDPATAPAGTYPQIIAANGDLTIGSLINPTPITFGGYTTDGNITIIGTSVTITGLLKTTGDGKTIAITATATDITFSGAGAIENAPAKNGFTTLSATKGTINSTPTTAISGSKTSLTVGGALSFTGPFDATTLSVTGNGSGIAINGSGNKLGSVSVANGGGVVAVNDSTGDLAVTGITGGPVTVTAAGAVTQSGSPIVATALIVNGVGSAITLNGANKIDSFAASNAGGSITITDTTSGLVLNGLEGSTVTIQAPGAITQTKQPIKAAALRVYGSGTGPITLDAANNVSSLLAGNGGEKISLTNIGAGSLDLAGINGGMVDINTKGAVTQSAAVNATALTVNASGNAITLNTQSNTATSFASSNGVGNIAFKRTGGGLALAGITGGTVTIDAAGAVTQSAAVNATSLTVNATGNPITLNTQANVLGSFSSSNGVGSITLRDTIGDLTLNTITSGPLTVVAAGKVLANQVQITGNATITTSNGGGLDVGPLANGLLKSTGQLDLRGVQGPVRLINGGQIIGTPILVNSSNPINVGGLITTTDQLNQAVATVNTLPTIVGSTYEIVVGANLVLTQTIVANRPMTLRGTSAAITLSGSATATTGMSIGAGGSGSRVTSLAFSGFTGTGIQLSNAQNVAVSGVTVNSSGYGLSVAGTSTGSTVRGSTFNSCPNAIVLSSATGVTIGGTAAGQPNRINSSARAGVFATGFCTGSSVIKTSFVNTPVRYNTGSSRNLRIVQ